MQTNAHAQHAAVDFLSQLSRITYVTYVRARSVWGTHYVHSPLLYCEECMQLI